MRRFFGPGLVLFFLAPAIGEMTCGNTPPGMFFNPLASGKIVIRMLANRPKLVLVLPVAALGELIALSGALWDTFVSSAGHAVWKRYEQG